MQLKRIAAISTLNKLKLFLFLPIMASAMVPAYSAFSAPAPIDAAPIDAGDTGDTGEALKIGGRDCEARFESNGTYTDWVNLGSVKWPERRRKCQNKAKDYINNLNFNQFGYTGQQICDKGGQVTVYYDTRVEGMTISRDGNVQSNLQANCVQKCQSTYVP